MASTAIKAFAEFRDDLTLTDKQREALRDRRATIRRYLRDNWTIREIFFGGSHARGTKIRRVGDVQGDVDIYVVLDDSHRSAYGGIFGKPPKQLLSDIKATLDNHLTTPTVRADSPAVRITYKDMIVDVIPAFRRSLWTTQLDIPYYDAWMVATPKKQEDVFNKLNSNRGYRFKHIVRMIKHWRAVHPSLGLRSYHLEVLAYNIFDSRVIEDYRYGLRDFFDNAAHSIQYAWNDPGGSGNSVSAYLSQAGRENAASMLATAAELAQKAIDATTWEGEIDRWRSSRLLGSRFPAHTPS